MFLFFPIEGVGGSSKVWIRVGRRWEEISVTETETVAQLQDAFGSWVVHTAVGGTGIPTGNGRSFFLVKST